VRKHRTKPPNAAVASAYTEALLALTATGAEKAHFAWLILGSDLRFHREQAGEQNRVMA
jgi:hypothetical protein